MFFCLFILLPIFVTGHSRTQPEDVPSQQCREEFAKINGCIKNQSFFNRIDNGPLSDLSENQAVIDEITRVIDCFGVSNCSELAGVSDYLQHQRRMFEYCSQHSDSCWGNGKHFEVLKICQRVPRPPSMEVNEDICNNDLEPCIYDELKKKPECTEQEVSNFRALGFGLKMSCYMEYHRAELWKKYQKAITNV